MFINLLIAQGNYTSSERFVLYYKNYFLLNPANTDTSYLYNIKLGNKSQTGIFKGVNNIYADLDMLLGQNTGKNLSYLGFQFLNRREGEFISKSRIYLRYGVKLQISEKSYVSTGLMGGMVNYTFRSSQAGAGGSSLVPDVNIGIWYFRKSLGIGISGQQLFNSKLRPVVQEFTLNRYVNIVLFTKFRLSEEIDFTPHLYYHYLSRKSSGFMLAGVFLFNEFVEAGGGIAYQTGFHLQLGLNSISTRFGDVRFNFSYWAPYSSTGVNDNSLEIFAAWNN